MVVLRIGASSDISMALFTRMSTLPKASKAFLAMAFMLASLLTSVGTKRALPGPLSLLINSAASMPIWGVRDAITTLAPPQARDLEIPRPMLLEPPVTTATSPAMAFFFIPVLSTVRAAVTSFASILTSSLDCLHTAKYVLLYSKHIGWTKARAALCLLVLRYRITKGM